MEVMNERTNERMSGWMNELTSFKCQSIYLWTLKEHSKYKIAKWGINKIETLRVLKIYLRNSSNLVDREGW